MVIVHSYVNVYQRIMDVDVFHSSQVEHGEGFLGCQGLSSVVFFLPRAFPPIFTFRFMSSLCLSTGEISAYEV